MDDNEFAIVQAAVAASSLYDALRLAASNTPALKAIRPSSVKAAERHLAEVAERLGFRLEPIE